MTVHDFGSSLRKSKEQSKAEWWEKCYRAAFPGFESMEYINDNLKFQKAGIDRRIVTRNGGVARFICVDEKVRFKDWPDFLLETYSSVEHNRPGWIRKPLACDYIAYAFVPSKRCYMLPVPALQAAYKRNESAWSAYGYIDVENETWHTRNVPVPIEEVMLAVTLSFLVRWE